MSAADKYRALLEQQRLAEEKARQHDREIEEARRRKEAQKAAEEARRQAEEREKQQRAQQTLRAFGVNQELSALGDVVGRGKAKVEIIGNGLGLTLRWDHQTEDWPACVTHSWKEVMVQVEFDDQGRPTGLDVSGGVVGTLGRSCRTVGELQEELARAAVNPKYLSEKKWKREPSPPSDPAHGAADMNQYLH